MTFKTIKYRDWIFEVDKQTTEENYKKIIGGGAEGCDCGNCKNYIANREIVFPEDVRKLFIELGVDYQKEVEICTYNKLTNGLYFIGGWFHFKGKIKNGKDYRLILPNGGYSMDLTKINQDFKIGFAEESTETYFENKDDLVQIEFTTNIPWIIEKALET